MSSQRMIRREKKRQALSKKYRDKVQQLRKELNDPALSMDAKFKILAQLENKIPRDGHAVRLTRRCQLTGRSRGVYRKFGLCRNEIRRRAMQGELPGVVLASW